ncbi:MAG: hypothetical protein HY751_02435 [Nitrospinae bacterium]|nr:hypothetical protein [Nitrospinota bacterium]
MNRQLLIGVDFDNTIADYDDLIFSIALERGFTAPGADRGKKSVRDAIRLLPEGDILWQSLQAEIYGPRMRDAKLKDGAREFFERCHGAGITTCVISHKTEYAGMDTTGTNLRSAAMGWMAGQGFFSPGGLGLKPGQVYFESTRFEKVERIGAAGCTHFIDDLEEVFLEDSFPADVGKILFCQEGQGPFPPGVVVMKTWKEIEGFFFAASPDSRSTSASPGSPDPGPSAKAGL